MADIFNKEALETKTETGAWRHVGYGGCGRLLVRLWYHQ